MEKEKIIKVCLFTAKVFKSIWTASYTILMLITYMILLNILMTYYQDQYNLTIQLSHFIDLIYILRDFWKFFWIMIFSLELYRELKEDSSKD